MARRLICCADMRISHRKRTALSNPQACSGEPVESGRDLVGFEAAPTVLGGPGGGGEGAQAVDRGAGTGQGERPRFVCRSGPAAAADAGLDRSARLLGVSTMHDHRRESGQVPLIMIFHHIVCATRMG